MVVSLKGLWIKLLPFTVIILLSIPVKSQPAFAISPHAIQLYDLTLHNRFRSADSLIKKMDRQLASDAAFQLGVINYYWWKYISSGHNEEYADLMAERLKLLESACAGKTESSGYHHLFLLITGYAFNARIALADKSYGQVVTLLSKYRHLVKQSFGKEADYPPFYLTSGLYNYVYAEATGKIPLLPVFTKFNPEIEKKMGILYLRKAALSDNQLIKTEALYFLMKIKTELDPDLREAAFFCKVLNRNYPDNILFNFYQFKILFESGRQQEAVQSRKELEEKILKSQLNAKEREYYHELILETLQGKLF